jgi:hypothetical protein
MELLPICIAINELSPKHKFARENLLLIGILQGKGEPPFKVLMEQMQSFVVCLTYQQKQAYLTRLTLKEQKAVLHVKSQVLLCNRAKVILGASHIEKKLKRQN